MTSGNNSNLTRQLKQEALELGADLVGVAPVERWDTPPPLEVQGVPVYPPTGYGPADLMPSGRSVIVLAIGQLEGVIESNVTDAATTYAYGNYGYVHLNRALNSICFDLARWLEARACRTLPLGPSMGGRYNHIADEDESIIAPLYGTFSLKRAAVLAGLGRKAKNGLVANPVHGVKIRMACLITAGSLEGDPLLPGDPCPPGCTVCMDVCPMQAVTPDGRVNHYKCASDCGRRGTSWEDIRRQMRDGYPVDVPGTDYVAHERFAIDGAGNRLCKVACQALCPLGENSPLDVLRRAKGWEASNPRVKLNGFPASHSLISDTETQRHRVS